MQSVMFLDCFVQTLSKKNLWGAADPPPPLLVKEGLMLTKPTLSTKHHDFAIVINRSTKLL